MACVEGSGLMAASTFYTTERKNRPVRAGRREVLCSFPPIPPAGRDTTTSLTMQKISIPTTIDKPNSLILPRNGRDPAAVQQWSNEVRLVTVAPSNAPGRFDATVNGELLVRS